MVCGKAVGMLVQTQVKEVWATAARGLIKGRGNEAE